MITLTDIVKKHLQISNDVYSGRIKHALDALAPLIRFSANADYFYQFRNISENYQNLLKYAFEGFADPEREKILLEISGSILTLADDVKFEMSEKEYSHKNLERAAISKEFGEDMQSVADHLDELLTAKAMQKMLEEAGTTAQGTTPVDPAFRFIWLSGKLHEKPAESIHKMVHSGDIPWYEKSLIVSALTLNLLNHFDPKKILLLTEFIDEREHQVYQRALTGLLFVLILYDKRINYFPQLTNRMKELSLDENLNKDVEALLLQLLMAQETEKITKAFEEEVLPEMQKMMPRMEDKLQIGNEEEDPEGKNPGWKDILDEVPGLFERIEKFTKMQMEGGDVFMSTFSLLKRFDFFNRMSNWFMPYYSSNPDLVRASVEEEEFYPRLVEGLERAFYLCNSDKYSFALNFHSVPPQQRSMLVSYFEAELEQMKEMASEEEILSPEAASNSIFIQYIQDLYRFFKLYPFRNEFEDIFRVPVHFNQLHFYKTFFERDAFTERLAGFYFEKERYPEAIELYQYLSDKQPLKGEYFEKIGYSFQKLGRYQKAITFYKKADLFEGDHLWIMKKLGWCSMKIKDFTQALSYYTDAAILKPDDLKIQSQIAQCNLNLRNFEEALEHYSRVEFYQQDNLKVLRPIAYLHFVLGKLSDASMHYQTILQSASPTAFDYMNAAHVMLSLGKRNEAMESYLLAMNDPNFSKETFISAFTEDIPYLVKNGLRFEDMPLILDFLAFRFDTE